MDMPRKYGDMFRFCDSSELPPTPNTPTVSSFETQRLKNDIQALKNASEINESELLRQQKAVDLLFYQNTDLYKAVSDLRNDMKLLKSENAELRAYIKRDHRPSRNRSAPRPSHAMGRSRSPSRERVAELREVQVSNIASHYSDDESSRVSEVVPIDSFHRDSLPIEGSQSADTSVSPKKTPRVVLTLNKRKVHNLDKVMPPMYTQIPTVPITEKEIVVFFFTSLSRPIVSVRMYARGWRPAKITDVLNEHREIDPPFLRNTCSVKCKTAQKRGIEKYGEARMTAMRNEFMEATIEQATEMIRISDDESAEATDVDILDLLQGLKIHPEDDEESGIFSKIVRYCSEHKLSWPLSRAHKLIDAVEHGVDPDTLVDSDTSDMSVEPLPSVEGESVE